MGSICAICQSIPFPALPALPAPPNVGFRRLGDDSDLPILRFEGPGPIGFPWHTDLGALAASSGTCCLCNVVQAGVQQWCERRATALQNKFPEMTSAHEINPVPERQRLFLTKRNKGAPGFLVYTQHPSTQSDVYLLTGVAFSVETTHDTGKELTPRLPNPSSGSKRSLDVVSSWVRKCHDTHDDCPRDETPLPSRILEVGESGDSIKLVEPVDGQRGRYASLSYCWGDAVNFTTTRQSLNARRQGIELSDIPKTFLDAVIICRHLDIRYLWIDSLCVCQDDADDWARQSAYMSDVYTNAYIVIAVNHARNSSQGIFHDRTWLFTMLDHPVLGQGVHARLISNHDEYDWNRRGFLQEPLSKRGWAFQERLLARRTLHYNTEQMYFECDQGVLGEDGSFQDSRHLRKCEYTPVLRLKGVSLWYYLIEDFASRQLTKTSDKSLAISGLGKLFARRFQAEYVAGLWSTAIVEGLAWKGFTRKIQAAAPNECIGPSWSWTSYDGNPMWMRFGKRWRRTAEVVEWHVKLKTEANPFSEVENAWLLIRAPIVGLIPLTEVPKSCAEKSDVPKDAGLTPLLYMRTLHTTNPEGHIIHVDDGDLVVSEKWKQLDLKVLVLGTILEPGEGSEDDEDDQEDDFEPGCGYGLVVTDTDCDHGKAMKRIGFVELSIEEANNIMMDEANRQIVTLV
ncbi:HET-domain-containing protein [Xylaria grammica]|nr:HET-domain-containing protein [Xylaria grammica]